MCPWWLWHWCLPCHCLLDFSDSYLVPSSELGMALWLPLPYSLTALVLKTIRFNAYLRAVLWNKNMVIFIIWSLEGAWFSGTLDSICPSGSTNSIQLKRIDPDFEKQIEKFRSRLKILVTSTKAPSYRLVDGWKDNNNTH